MFPGRRQNQPYIWMIYHCSIPLRFKEKRNRMHHEGASIFFAKPEMDVELRNSGTLKVLHAQNASLRAGKRRRKVCETVSQFRIISRYRKTAVSISAPPSKRYPTPTARLLCRAEEKRRMSIRTLPNFFGQNTNFPENFCIFFLEIF